MLRKARYLKFSWGPRIGHKRPRLGELTVIQSFGNPDDLCTLHGEIQKRGIIVYF